MTYTADQIKSAVEGTRREYAERDDFEPMTRDYPEGHYMAVNGYKQTQWLGDWDDLNVVEGFIVIDGEPVDFRVVDETGGMDAGSRASVTIKIGDQFFTKEGYYQSHYGYDWDGDFYESTPTEVVTTKYLRKK